MLSLSTGSVIERHNLPTFLVPSVTKAVVFTSMLLAGTGASYPVNKVDQWRPFIQSKVQFAFESNQASPYDTNSKDVDLRTIAQHLGNIRQVLSPSMSELAKDLGITRQALYKWLSGENQPDDEVKTKFIVTLSNIADEFSKANISDAKLLIKMKAFDGLSLMNLVANGEDWHRPVMVLIDEARTMSQAAERANFISSKAKPSDDWKSSMSIPGSGLKD
ncbi:helix-turn-helix domain-containing protein [Yersinia proxima]|uniref:helix-turn-helix domain-containing protein n=1 Tax=Yersinia proxima TaxID=2890316 RepID=UPI003D69C7D0